MTRQLKTNRIHLCGILALAGLATACTPSHQGQSRYGVQVLADSSQPALRPSCNTYVQPCGVAPSPYMTGYYVEQFAYPSQMPAYEPPASPAIVTPAPVEPLPMYIDPPAPILEPALPAYTSSEPYWPESNAPVPTWTPLRK